MNAPAMNGPKRKTARGSWRGLVLSVLTIAAPTMWLVGCGTGSDSTSGDPPQAPVVPVRVAALTERLFHPGVPASGEWIASNELVVSAPFTAIVETIGPQVGDHLSRGQAVGWLTTRESQAAVEGAEILYHQAGDEAARAEALRALALARHDLIRVPLAAPGPGTVIRRSVAPGAVVAAGTELLAIVPEGALVFEAHVSLVAAGSVAVGQRAHITSEGGPAVEARVRRFLPTAGVADQSALVWLSPESAVPLGSLGRFGTVFIETGSVRSAVAVPDSALVEDDLTGEVRVARVDRAGLAVWTAVKVGAEEHGWRELLAPMLPSGSLVVIRGQHGLPDSTRVVSAP